MPRLPVVLGMPGDAELVEQARTSRAASRTIVEGDAGRGVEVDAQLVGMVGVGRRVGPDVEAEAAEVHRPQRRGRGRRRPTLATSCRSAC